MKMRDTTPYLDRPEGEVAREAECMRLIFQGAPEVSYIYETFGGFAVTSRVLAALFPFVKFVATDLSPECCEEYNRLMHGRGECFNLDALEGAGRLLTLIAEPVGVSMDYNKFTLLDLDGRSRQKLSLLETVVRHQPRWIQLTDSAVRYLHLNAVRYGVNPKTSPGSRPHEVDQRRSELLHQYVGTMEEKMQSLFGLKLDAVAYHYAATYLRFSYGKVDGLWTMQRG